MLSAILRANYFSIAIPENSPYVKDTNKRAQRALGRSPEEKIKGQGEAIYRGPLMLST